MKVATETSRRSFFRTPFGNQRVNGFQTPLKVARHHYYPLFPWISGKLSWKKLGYCDHKSSDCLLTHWLPMASIPAAICKIFYNNFKPFYLKNARLFLEFLLNFWNVHEIYNIFKKSMSVLGWLFPKLLFRKEVATETSRRSCFRTPFGNQRVNGFQTPLKVARHHYYRFFPGIPCKVSWKKTALLWS